MDFSLSPEIESLRQKVAAFVEAEIMPLENDKANYDAHENFKESVVDALREKAKAAGLWGFQLPKERGGLDVGVAGMAVLYEEAARSPFGPVVFNCAPPDDGPMIVLNKILDAEQTGLVLQRMIDGTLRSAFPMTGGYVWGGSDVWAT